ncbi:hypothetical protein [Mycoplasma todarodis]|uniref:Uncharacterized protein n=1 Tax=Mycoplasma todarodis TaxID=1937191 RepID=A0A4R0XKT6_9MOLU|nr:hypothetical protein [Mycoplasma todarodis]TCG11253.1 hypothetical protein C4B25_01950 [Mycoplasma todarodis]
MATKKETKSSNSSAQRDQWWKWAIYAAIAWVIGITLFIFSGSIASIGGHTADVIARIIAITGGIICFIAWVVVIIFGIFTIVYSLTFSDATEKIVGIITGILCILIPVVGVIMAWILYYSKKGSKAGDKSSRDQWWKWAIRATIIWVIGLILMIVAGAINVRVASPIMGGLGAIMLFTAWIIVVVFGIFTIFYSITMKDNDKILGIICGILCIIFPIVGVIMAWILYYSKK